MRKVVNTMPSSAENNEYAKKVELFTPPSPLFKDCLLAFLSGGTVCLTGEALFTLFRYFNLTEKDARTCVSVSLILITALLTGFGVFDKLAKFAGAGLSVPITGFANSVCAPAIEHSVEGFVHGTAVNMFSLAGPVIVFGCSFACIYGVIYFILSGGAG